MKLHDIGHYPENLQPFIEHQFDIEEIAKIRNLAFQGVEMLLEAAPKDVRTSFLRKVYLDKVSSV